MHLNKKLLKFFFVSNHIKKCSYAISLQGRRKSVRKSSIRAVPYATNTLYNYAKDGYLRYRPKTYRIKKKKYHGVKTDRGVFAIHHISLRPKKVEERKEFGHWEVDGIEGSRGSDAILLTFLESKTRYLVAVKARSKTNKSINEAMDFFFRFYDKQVKSCTFDRGNGLLTGVML